MAMILGHGAVIPDLPKSGRGGGAAITDAILPAQYGAAIVAVSPGYFLYDDFSVALTATNVDGTLADPRSNGTRSTGETGSISGGNYVLSGAADDSLWYDETIARAVGQVLTFTPTITDATNTIEFGFDTDQSGALAANAIRMASDLLKPYDGGVAGPNIYVPSDATEYSLAVCLLTAGAAYFLDGNLLYKGGANATATLYAGISNTDASGTIADVKVPQTLWAPTPIAADTGTSADVAGTYYTDGGTLTGIEAGGDGEGWNGETWSNGVDGATNTPTLGTELLTNGDFSAWTSDDPDGWTLGAQTPGDKEISEVGTDEGHGDSGTGSANAWSDIAGNVSMAQNVLPLNTWLHAEFDYYHASGLQALFKLGSSGSPIYLGYTDGVMPFTSRATDSTFITYSAGAAAHDYTFNSISIKAIPPADLFRSISNADTPYVYASANWIITAKTQAGVVVCLDDADTPANFIIAYHDGTSVITEKCLAGTYTTLGTVTATYDADEPLVVRTLPDGNDMSVWVWYDGAYIANYTLDETTDAAIIAGTLHGLFSTHADNDCSDVTIYAATGHSLPGA